MQPHEMVLSPSVQNALGMMAWCKFAGDPDPVEMVKELRQQVREVQDGDLGRVEAMLYGQAVPLGAIFTSSSDTEVLVHLIACSEADSVDDQIREALEQVDGAYSLVITVGRTMYAVVDSRGFRPLVIGRMGSGIIVASESCALDLIGASFNCELRPGDFVRIENGHVTHLPRLAPRPVSRCVFELVYFARPDSTLFGESVDRVRRELGRQLAREQPAAGGEVVFSVPDSSNAMALGFSEVSGIKLEHGLIRNHYVGRTFINPTQALRVAKVKIKFNPVREVMHGKSVVVVEASTSLANPAWLPLSTNTVTVGSAYFGDPNWTNHPARFYRLRSP